MALLWKNLISAGQSFTWRFWLILLIVGTAVSLSLGQNAHFSNLASVLGMIVGTFLIWSLMLGPQLLRQDFRQDMQVADVLKMYPLRGWQIALGELLAPAVILTVIQWFLAAIATLLLLGSPLPGLKPQLIIAGGISVAMLVPVLNLLTLQIPNAAVLLFPAWFQAGKEGPHGIEATGQRIISVLGQVLAFLTALIPAAIVSTVVFIALRWAFTAPLPLVVVAGAVSAAFIVGLEAALGVMLVGRFFERLDLSSEPPS